MWAQETLWSEDFSSYSADDVPSGGTYSYGCTNGTKTSGSTAGGTTAVKNEALAEGTKPELMVGKKGSGTGATGGTFTAIIPLDNIEGTLTLKYKQNANGLKVTMTAGVATSNQTKSTKAEQTLTLSGVTTSMTSITIVFEATSTSNVRLDDIVLTGNKASSVEAPTFSPSAGFFASAQTVTITTNEVSGHTYYTTDGTAPSDASTLYTEPISITSTTTLKAVTYNSVGTEHSAVVSATYGIVEDGVFDFVTAGGAGYDYGSGESVTNDGNYYNTDETTWTAGNVTMVVAGKYRWWYNGNDLRFYSNDPVSSATFSVPNGYVITKIVSSGGNFTTAASGTLSGNTWTGAQQSIKLSTASSTVNFTKFVVTYAAAQSITPAKTYTTLTSADNLDFSDVTGLEAYIATAVAGGSVQMTQVNKVPANTGLVLKATTPGSAVNVPVFDGTGADDVSTNKMKGSATATTAIAEGEGYILVDGVFQPSLAGDLPAGKAYLNVAVSSAPVLNLNFGDDTTGIKVIDNGQLTIDNYYNLAGQRVTQPTKGLYIVNGKKVVIK